MARYTAYYGDVGSRGRGGNFPDDTAKLEEEGIDFEAEYTDDVDFVPDYYEGTVLVFPDEENARAAAEFVYVVDHEEDRPLGGLATLRG